MLRRNFLRVLAHLPLIGLPVAAAAKTRFGVDPGSGDRTAKTFFAPAQVKHEGQQLLYVENTGTGSTWGEMMNTNLRDIQQRLLTEEEIEDFPYKVNRTLVRRRISARRAAQGLAPLA